MRSLWLYLLWPHLLWLYLTRILTMAIVSDCGYSSYGTCFMPSHSPASGAATLSSWSRASLFCAPCMQRSTSLTQPTSCAALV